MTKKEIKTIIKQYDYTMIDKSFYVDTDLKGIMFNAYDVLGNCNYFHIDLEYKVAHKHFLSWVCVHKEQEISNWFFK